MPQGNRTSITVKQDTFEMLKRNKPDGVTWDCRLKQLQYATDRREDTARKVVGEIRDVLDVEGDVDVASIVKNRVEG